MFRKRIKIHWRFQDVIAGVYVDYKNSNRSIITIFGSDVDIREIWLFYS